MTWYRVYKTFRGGKSPFHYIEVPKYTKNEDVKEYVECWADKAPGGHCYGWTVYWRRVKQPPKKWFLEQIEDLEQNVDYFKTAIVDTENKIQRFKRAGGVL